MSIFLSVLGVIATLLFGAWSVYLAINSRYPGELTIVREELIDLFDSVVKNISDLQVLYKGRPATPNLVLLRGAIVNTGKRDISPQMVEQPLRGQLPDGYTWLAARVVSSSPNVSANLDVGMDAHNVTFATGLLRRGEFIRFQALAEVPLSTTAGASLSKSSAPREFWRVLSFSHRIAETGPVREAVLESAEWVRARRPRVLLFIGAMMVAVGFAAALAIRGFPGNLVYAVRTQDGETRAVKVRPTADGSIHVKSVQTGLEERWSVAEFQKALERVQDVVPDDKFPFVFTLLFCLNPGVPGFMLLWFYRDSRRRTRLRNLLGLAEPFEPS
jgi:hypothetical protein